MLEGSVLRIRFFGPFTIYVNDNLRPRFHSRKTWMVLAYLCLAKGPVLRDEVAYAVWPNGEGDPRSYLRLSLTEIRKALGAEKQRLHADADTLSLNLDGADVDLFSIECAIEKNDPKLLQESVKLADQTFLDGWGDASDETWVMEKREACDNMCREALSRLYTRAVENQDYGDARYYLRRLALIDGLKEEQWRHLLDVLIKRGDHRTACQTYRVLQQLLIKLNGQSARPKSATTSLYRDIPLKVRQEAEAPLPPIERHLPSRPTPLIGRENLIEEVKAHLARRRLVTLTGLPGIGKTHLALHIAQELAGNYVEAPWFVDLSAIADPDLLPQALTGTMKIQVSGKQEPEARLIEVLKTKEWLLVLDNCEHLLAPCARLVERLLNECPYLTLLATSRERLRLEREIPVSVPLLSLPDPSRPYEMGTITQSEAVRLFVVFAQKAHPSFTLTQGNIATVADLCCRLEGIPLALELAAAQMRFLPVEEIASRLKHRFKFLVGGSRSNPKRHQTLNSALEWSYDLLTEPERLQLRRLALFTGGWTLEAAEAVCAENPHFQDAPPVLPLAREDVFLLLVPLVEKSWVAFDEQQSRYSLLQTLREFGKERWTEEEKIHFPVQHTRYFLGLAERAGRHIHGGNQVEWLRRLEAEHANLHAALVWIADQNELDDRVAWLPAMEHFWTLRGRVQEGRDLLDKLLQRGKTLPTCARSRILNVAARLALWQGDSRTARMLTTECLTHDAMQTEPHDRAEALLSLSIALHVLGDNPEAHQYCRQSLTLWQELDDTAGLAAARHHLGDLFRLAQQYPQAREQYEISLAIARQRGDLRAIGTVLDGLQSVAVNLKEFATARTYAKEGLSLYTQLGDRQRMASVQHALADLALREEDLPTAEKLLQECLTTYQEICYPGGIASTLLGLGGIAHKEKRFAEAETLLRQALAMEEAMGNKRNIAMVQGCIADVLREQQHYEASQTLYEQSLALYMEMGDDWGITVMHGNLAKMTQQRAN